MRRTFAVDPLLRHSRDFGNAREQREPPPVGWNAPTGERADLLVALIPQRPTICLAIAVSCWMSDSAPVLGSP